MLWLVIVSIASLYRESWGWTHGKNEGSLSAGSPCNSTLGAGICTNIRQCQPYVQDQITYDQLKRCSFKGLEEITCCPVSFQNRVRTEVETTQSVRTTETVPRAYSGQTIKSRRFPGTTYRTNRDEGSVCHLSSRTGACTRISRCESYLRREVPYADLTRCSFIGNEEVICCPPSTQRILQTRGFTRRRNFVPIKQRPSKIACDAYKSNSSSRRVTFNILDGEAASPGEYPHVGAMLYTSERAGVPYDVRCVASLIAERFALTAAHCVARSWPAVVRFGSVEWDPSVNVIYRFDAKVKRAIQHEEYVYPQTYNDIALIQFTEDISFNTLVFPACLHSTREDLSPTIDLKVAGWGSTDGSVNSKSYTLLYTSLRTVELKSCNQTFDELGFAWQYPRGLHDGQYCAVDTSGVSNRDSCYGDSGGPLMKDVDEKIWELVGLVSFGNGCGGSLPGVYARVSFHLDWIESKVWPNGRK